MLIAKIPHQEIARLYCISKASVYYIGKNMTWKHVID